MKRGRGGFVGFPQVGVDSRAKLALEAGMLLDPLGFAIETEVRAQMPGVIVDQRVQAKEKEDSAHDMEQEFRGLQFEGGKGG